MMTSVLLQTPQHNTAMHRYAAAARRAGVPRDQLLRFVAGGYVAQPHQLPLHAAARQADQATGPTMIAFGGRRGPGKTHATFAQIALDDCQRVDGLKFLFLRKVLKSAKESFDDVRRKVLYTMPHDYRTQAGMIVFPNDSRIVLGHFRNESDIDNYLGVEYDGAVIEEMTQLSKLKIDMVRGSIRSTKPGWRPRLYGTANPGGIGHQYFRSTFVLPHRQQRQTDTLFLPASADANKYLDSGYRSWLQGLSGMLGKMWRDGDWDIAGGAFFTNWQYDRIAVAPRATIPTHWRIHLSMDYGFQHWNIIYVYAQDADGMVWFLDELAMRRALIPQIAEALTALLARYGLTPCHIQSMVAGGDLFGTESTGKSPADTWRALGYSWTPATMARKAGAAEWLKRLGNSDAGLAPTVRITTRCTRLLEIMPMLVSNAHDPEDVLKVDCDEDGEGGDDAYDASRYGLMTMHSFGVHAKAGPPRPQTTYGVRR